MSPSVSELAHGLDNLLDDRDYLYRLVETIDWDAQLDAIRGVLRLHRQSAEKVTDNILALRAQAESYEGPYHHHVVDQHTDAVWFSSYSEAAISLSALGMVVPMIESVFSQSLSALGALYAESTISPPAHRRWDRAGADDGRWNCQIYYDKKREPHTDIIRGLPQLSEAAGLSACLSPEDVDWIVALLSYRNRMFHGGFEWSIEQRDKFLALVEGQGWQKYFQWSESDHRPWIFYLRDEVIDAMPDRVRAILDSLGRFARDLPHGLFATHLGPLPDWLKDE